MQDTAENKWGLIELGHQTPALQLSHLHMIWHARVALQVMAQIMGAEAALMRIQFVSGTHAISSALFAVLRPGDEMLAVAGQ